MTVSAVARIAGVEISPDHFICGERVSSAQTFPDTSPIDEAHLADIARGGAAEADAAVEAARAAFPSWAALGPEGRARHLFAVADLIEERQ